MQPSRLRAVYIIALRAYPLPLQILERHLTSLGSLGHPGGILLEVVTGLGRHSNTGQPRLLPAVVRYLADAGYRFDSQEGNAGVILVHIGC